MTLAQKLRSGIQKRKKIASFMVRMRSAIKELIWLIPFLHTRCIPNVKNVAPVDVIYFGLYQDVTKGCLRTEKCHMSLSRYGYYACSPGAHLDRVFGFDIGIKKLSSVNDTAFRKQLNTLCRYYGHFKEPNEYVTEGKMSKSWVKAYKRYKETKPKMSLY